MGQCIKVELAEKFVPKNMRGGRGMGGGGRGRGGKGDILGFIYAGQIA